MLKVSLKKFILLEVFAGISFLMFSEVPSYKIEFSKGNIQDKTESVNEAAKQGDISLGIKAIDFSLQEYEILGEDSDLISLLVAGLNAINTDPHNGQTTELSKKIAKVFTTFKNDNVRISVLERMKLFPSDESVSLINSFISENAKNKVPMNNVLQSAIESIGKIGNNSSFILLLAIILDNVWPDSSKQIESSFGSLANNDQNDIIKLLSKVSIGEKLKILQLVSKNENISKNIKGNVAENALAESITISGDISSVSKDQINLQLLSLQLLADSKWTRAATLISDYFTVAKNEYENNLMSAEDFSTVISNSAAVGSSDIGNILSTYLDSLNKSMDQGNAPVNTVVLAVIKSLGSLGNKTAFDYLLYVTYLDYPEVVTSAAKEALANLKW